MSPGSVKPSFHDVARWSSSCMRDTVTRPGSVKHETAGDEQGQVGQCQGGFTGSLKKKTMMGWGSALRREGGRAGLEGEERGVRGWVSGVTPSGTGHPCVKSHHWTCEIATGQVSPPDSATCRRWLICVPHITFT
ncbi:hypothetical protein BaRGS_00009724 [Batillaria attramentaria]|uniref:Uncharacterized protein n=1 Tax=Batillaria attramentaria TaxID=370345 RepID=A0ABD0LIM7_9CAEN